MCQLYSSAGSFIKNLTNCKTGTLLHDTSYTLKYSVDPSIYQDPISKNVTILTESMTAQCSIAGGLNRLVPVGKDTILQATVTGTDSA